MRKDAVMILLPCAWCGPRDVTEFAHIGEVSARPGPDEVTPGRWRGYLYLRANPCGWTRETWYHRMGCRRFITVERHTETNEVRSVSAAGGMMPQAPGRPGAEDPPPTVPSGAAPAREAVN
jgi:heterotetrameric sarcosine oxidase delta subunit